jgi:methionyl-tRNA formyltransferase
MNLIFLGTGEFAAPALRAICDAGQRVLRVISQPDRPSGRGREIRPTPVHAAATELGIPHIQAEDVNALSAAELANGAELGVVVDFGQKIGPALLAALPRGCVNIHGSLLPKYRGAAPFQWAILRGEPVTGVTAFLLNERWDAGAILGRRETPINATETADELHDRLAQLGAALIVDVLRRIEAGAAQPQPQDASQATRAPKLTKAQSRIDFAIPAEEIVRQIHGLWSWPAAKCVFESRSGKSERLLLIRAQLVDRESRPSDEVVAGAFLEDSTVQCDPGRLRLLEVQPAGGKRMSFEAFANGRRVAPPDRLTPIEPS